MADEMVSVCEAVVNWTEKSVPKLLDKLEANWINIESKLVENWTWFGLCLNSPKVFQKPDFSMLPQRGKFSHVCYVKTRSDAQWLTSNHITHTVIPNREGSFWPCTTNVAVKWRQTSAVLVRKLWGKDWLAVWFLIFTKHARVFSTPFYCFWAIIPWWLSQGCDFERSQTAANSTCNDCKKNSAFPYGCKSAGSIPRENPRPALPENIAPAVKYRPKDHNLRFQGQVKNRIIKNIPVGASNVARLGYPI